MTTDDWRVAIEEVTNVLSERAKVRGMISYSELVSRVTSMQFEAHDPRLFKLLGEVSSNEDAMGRGMLSVVVVHKHGDMQPGPGFFNLAKQLGRDTNDQLVCWMKELEKVHTYWRNQ